jgi:hypothetical protein
MPEPRIRANYLSFAERERMKARILYLHRMGKTPTAIGGRVGLTANFVRNVLVENGETLNEQKYHENVDPMWATDDEQKRREAIIRRAARGAAQTIQENAANDKAKEPAIA